MPEGDTIHRTANAMRASLAGRRVVRLEAPRLPAVPREPGAVRDVEARGKHLLIHFDGDLTLHTHLGMTGSWHLYRPGQRWTKRASAARVVLEVPGAVAVCFAAPLVRLVETGRQQRDLDRLGPDLTAPDPDLDEALRRMESLPPERTVAEALLDQSVAAGVGNVFKSEVLFACRIDPATPVSVVDPPRRREMLQVAARMLRANLSGWRRMTVPEGLAVYKRAGRPCRRCGTPIRSALQGSERPRRTYWCPSCQR